MKPCHECVEKYGKPACTHSGCCLFDGAPRLPHESSGSKVEGAMTDINFLACHASLRQGS